MIIDKTNGRLNEIKTFAKENNLLENFNNTFSRLETYSAKGYTVNIYSDFAPLSMEFSITENDKLILYGGFIFHGHMMALGVVVHIHFLFHLTQKKKQAGQFTHKI